MNTLYRKMRLDFICPGKAKCGTTTLHNIMSQHPNICLPSLYKEPRWLNDYNLCTNRGLDWFAEHYYGISNECPQKDNVLYGEINPSLSMGPAKRIHDLFGECKIIFMFRNPVERLWSHFNMNFDKSSVMRSATEEKVLRDCKSRTQAFNIFCKNNFEKVGGKIRYTGSYSHVLSQAGYAFNYKTYLRFFKEENMKIILFEDFIRETQVVCEDLFEFLGIEGGDQIDYSVKSNEGSYSDITEDEYSILADLEKKRIYTLANGTKEEMKEIYKQIRLEKAKIKANTQEVIKQRPSQDCVEMLQDFFSDDKRYIEEHLQRDLSKIWF